MRGIDFIITDRNRELTALRISKLYFLTPFQDCNWSKSYLQYSATYYFIVLLIG